MQVQSHSTAARARHGVSLEYSVYFTLIFLISLPRALLRQLIGRPPYGASRFFVAQAWAMARMVTPRIFSA